MPSSGEIFILQVCDQYLIYAPLIHYSALVDGAAAREIHAGLRGETGLSPTVQPVVETLLGNRVPFPQVRTGPIRHPYFLGFIPTRGCNLGCIYCDFQEENQSQERLDLAIARRAIHGYLDLLQQAGAPSGQIHFFGGEPFFAEAVVHFVVEVANMAAAERGLLIQYEAATNGFYSADRCQWIADNFHAIVLSLDGPAEVHDRYRPTRNQRPTFKTVMRSAHIFSESNVDLSIRACVTQDTVARLPEIATWVSQELSPSSLCFESLLPSPLSNTAGLAPPDPWAFASNFVAAERILTAQGIQAIHSTTLLDVTHASFCPVGKDALIVSPDGGLFACYLLENKWLEKGLDMRIGRVLPAQSGEAFEIDAMQVERVRDLNVYHKSLCVDCFCRFHCAGGCHVNHPADGAAWQFDALCIQTRLISAAKLLAEMGQGSLVTAWFADRRALETAVWQASDRLSDWSPA